MDKKYKDFVASFTDEQRGKANNVGYRAAKQMAAGRSKDFVEQFIRNSFPGDQRMFDLTCLYFLDSCKSLQATIRMGRS